MPVKGIILIVLVAIVLAFGYRVPIYLWLKDYLHPEQDEPQTPDKKSENEFVEQKERKEK